MLYMKVLVVDGQGGKLGKRIIEEIKGSMPDCFCYAVGTNSLATMNMQKGGADVIATGENAVRVCSFDVDAIIGPVGIAIADSLYGEITSTIANAVACSKAYKILIPVNKCKNLIAGVSDLSIDYMIKDAVKILGKLS